MNDSKLPQAPTPGQERTSPALFLACFEAGGAPPELVSALEEHCEAFIRAGAPSDLVSAARSELAGWLRNGAPPDAMPLFRAIAATGELDGPGILERLERVERELQGLRRDAPKKARADRRGPIIASELDRARARKALKEAGYLSTRGKR